MRRFAIVAALALAACRHESADVFQGAPVILISVDTLRSDHLPAYGYGGVKTPNLDALRRDSILFQRAYSHCPMTLPSHLSILTGLLPTEHGVRNNIGYRFDGTKFRTLAAVLRAHGYRTGAAVSSYVLRSDTGIDAGFDFYDDSIAVAAGGAASEHQRSGYETLQVAQAWIARQASQPFFFFFHIYEPHTPYEPSYDGEIAKSDDIVGRLVATLKSAGLYDRAIVIFLSDHGEGLWQHGEDQHGILLYRESLQVPLMVKLPGAARRGAAIADPVQLADVFPTVLSLAGIEQSGRSLFAARAPIYSETLYPRIHLGWSELRSLIDARFQYIDGPRPELYGLARDAAETNDLVSTERRTAAAMRAQLAEFPSAVPPLQNIDPEEAAKLAALGYVGTAKTRSGPLPNPRDEVGHIAEIKQAFHLADQRRYDEAAAALRTLLQSNPRLADVWSKLGEILVESGRHDDAIAAYKAAMGQSEIFSADLALGLGFAYLEAGRPADAVAHAQLAVREAPRQSHELLARAYVQQRRFADAEASARQAIAEGDRQPSSILLLAEVQRTEEKLEAALQSIQEAERRANDLEIRHLYGIDYLRGDVLARLDRPDEAVVAYKREIDSSPQHLQSYANLAVIYVIEGKRAEAEKTLALMTRNNPHRGAQALAAKTRAATGL
ncbi:MAG TPA: sulfatase-like hydrolase/transferase [Thermoanaerobaculia bacterium]|nr:sulfatase-like hydrolase/transferase [Thermoanaerobaculia bacterium]